MRILLIIEGTYPWYRGGVSEWVHQYLMNLKDLEFNILQIATDEFNQLDPQDALYPLAPNVLDFYRIPPPQINHDWEHACTHWYEDHKSVITESLKGCDLIHVTNTGFAGWLGGTCAEHHELPMMLTEHAIYWKEVEMGAFALECGYKIPESENARDTVTTAFKDFASYTYQMADKIVTVSESNIPFQKDLGAKEITYIPNGIPAKWLDKNRVKNEHPVIGWVGRCAEMKNPLAFFDLAESYQRLGLKAEFRMLLSDANERDLQRSVEEKAADYPFVKCIWNEPAEAYFNDMDYLVITSHNESQPLVMLEALAHHALPVGYEVGDLTEKYGLVFQKDASFDHIAEQMNLLWNDRNRNEEYLNERHERVRDKHTWEGIFGRYEDLMLKQVVHQ